MVINQTSVVGKNLTLSVDTLLKLGITVKKIFGPEHESFGDSDDHAGAVSADVCVRAADGDAQRHQRRRPEHGRLHQGLSRALVREVASQRHGQGGRQLAHPKTHSRNLPSGYRSRTTESRRLGYSVCRPHSG